MSDYYDLAERVSRGIALLDEKGPPDWRKRINLDILDLDHTGNCVLGQIYETEDSPLSGYCVGCKALGIEPYGFPEAALLGFSPWLNGEGVVAALTAAWRDALSPGRD